MIKDLPELEEVSADDGGREGGHNGADDPGLQMFSRGRGKQHTAQENLTFRTNNQN